MRFLLLVAILLNAACGQKISGLGVTAKAADNKPVEISTAAKSKWPQEPDGFKGIKFGDSVAEAITHSPNLQCSVANVPRGRVVEPSMWPSMCTLSVKLPGDGFDDLFATVVFENHRMRTIVGTFPSGRFSDVKDIFIDKYGPPMSDESTEIQTRIGAKYQQEVLTWTGENLVVSVAKFGDKIDQGRFAFALLEDVKANIKKQEEGKKSVLN